MKRAAFFGIPALLSSWNRPASTWLVPSATGWRGGINHLPPATPASSADIYINTYLTGVGLLGNIQQSSNTTPEVVS